MIIPAESQWGQELARWNKPYRYEQFPQMLYRAKRRIDGPVIVDPGDQNCKLQVMSENELRGALERGWRERPEEALELFESREQHRGLEAAHRAHDDRNMSERAKAEAKAAEAETVEHVPEVPEKRRARRGKRAA